MAAIHTLGEIRSWPARSSRRWFSQCDFCKRLRLVADYFEGYLEDGHGWAWACSDCLVAMLGDRAEHAKHGEYMADDCSACLHDLRHEIVHQYQQQQAEPKDA